MAISEALGGLKKGVGNNGKEPIQKKGKASGDMYDGTPPTQESCEEEVEGRKVGTGYRRLLPAPTLPNCPQNCSAPSPPSLLFQGGRDHRSASRKKGCLSWCLP